MRILTCDEIGLTEREASTRPGVTALLLIRRAGLAVVQFCLSHFKFRSVCVVCGKGENGGRGMAAAEALQDVAEELSVIILAKEESELSSDVAAACARLSNDPIWLGEGTGFELDIVRQAFKADLIIDAAADACVKTPLQGLTARAVEAINDAFGTVVSVDLPSGIEADIDMPLYQSGANVVYSHGIISFIAPKPAHIFGQLTTGPIAVSEIGVQPVLAPNRTGLNVITSQEVGIAFPPRPTDANKGQFGHVLVVAGSRGKAGAAALSGIAALRAGAGLVTVACPRSIQSTVAGFAAALMTEDLPETEEGTIATEAIEKVYALLAGKDVVVLGPGLSRNKETATFVRLLVARCPFPLVLDADGLNAFEGRTGELASVTETTPFRVLTPHPGEAARLLGLSIEEIQSDRVKNSRRISQETGSCVVLKGSRTIVAGLSGEIWINMSGNPALAKGGSGDVLSGIIAAALARHVAGISPSKKAGVKESVPINTAEETSSSDPLKSHQKQERKRNSEQISAFLKDIRVAGAVHLHGLAADIARDHLHENTVLATDLLDQLSQAFRECELQKDRELFYLQI
jgi:ADP-dependent NAD(P)H-hydrate dehydratase / NAD(P)H-hydrate epimerase